MQNKAPIKQPVDFRERLNTYSKLSFAELMRKLRSDFDTGLNDEDVDYLHERYGYNEIETENKNTCYRRLYESFVTPFNVILCVVVIISFFTDYYFATGKHKDLTSVVIVSMMVFLSGILDFIQDTKSSKASEKLKEMIRTTTTTLRNNNKVEVPLSDVVPGDIIILSAGSIIPADMRILCAKDLFISQSALTGESAPVEKFSDSFCPLTNKYNKKQIEEKTEISTTPDKHKNVLPLELNNICFMGTNVISGSGTGIVVSIGNETYFGSMAKNISHNKVETSFDKGIKDIGWLLIKFVLIMAIAVFVINGVFKADWIVSFIFAVSVAIGLTPEMLPVIVTTNLAKGAVVMSRKKTIVKNLSSIQNFGAMDILCTDKTGTLTEDKVMLEYHLNVHGEEDERVFKYGYLNSYYQTGLKNIMDIAVLDHKRNEEEQLEIDEALAKYHLIDEIPFDFVRKRMSVVLQSKNGKIQFITKGAVEVMVDICDYVEYHGKIIEFTDKLKTEIMDRMAQLNNNGMRVISVAHRTHFENNKSSNFDIQDEKSMVFLGFMAFLDPPKESAKDAIKDLQDYGVTIKVLTGDNELVSKYVCEKVGMGDCDVLAGPEIEHMSDKQLKEKIIHTEIFARLSPQQKSRIVACLREDGHVVGFMGDGINDALAMKKSDVAISVDTAVDIAKESADIILLEKNLEVLVNGVVEGRKIFGNIVKYIKMATSSNFGNMLSILIACIFLPFLPMLPIHILVLNLLYDISQTVIPWDNTDKEYLKKQRNWDIKSVKRFMLWLGPVSSIFDLSMFFILYFIFKYNDASDPHLVASFQTGWFVLSLITQTIIIHFVRTEKMPFIQSIASKPVILMTIIMTSIALVLPFTGLGRYMKLVPLPSMYYFWLLFLLVFYVMLVSITKSIYKKKYGNWL